MNHTPEPWKTVPPGHGLPTEYLCVQIGEDESYSTLELLPADAERIVACVNACTGTPDADLRPGCVAALQAENRALRESLHLLWDAAEETLPYQHQFYKAAGGNDPWASYTPEWSEAERVVAGQGWRDGEKVRALLAATRGEETSHDA